MTISATNKDQAANSARATPFQPSSYTAITELARKNVAPHRYLRDLLDHLAQVFDSPYAAIHARLASEVIHEECHRGPADPGFWKEAVQDVLTDAMAETRACAKTLRARNGSTTLALLAAPLYDGSGRSIGAFGLVVGPIAPEDVRGMLAALQALLAVSGSCVDQLGKRPSASGGVAAEKTGADRVKATGPIPPHSNPREFAFAVTNGLRTKLDLEQVSLGAVHRCRVKLLAISGLDEVPARSPGAAAMTAAMEECLDAGEPIVSAGPNPDATEKFLSDYPLTAQWQAAAKGDHVACVPLIDGEQVVGILSLRSRPDRPLADKQIEDLAAWAAGMAPVLALTTRAHRGLVTHAIDGVVSSSVRLVRGKSLAHRLGMALVLALAVAACSVPIPYSVRVPCRVVADEARRVCAPFAGMLTSSTVLSGQAVAKGQVLCTFDTRDLELQRAELDAQHKILESEENKALAAGKTVDARIAFLNRQMVSTRLALIQRKIESAIIRATIEGVVVMGDMRQRIGETMPMGEMLFEIAPTESWKLELDVPEHAVICMTAGLGGEFSLASKPEKAYGLVVKQAVGQGTHEQGKTVFKVEAAMSGRQAWFRPGMEGVARLPGGNRPLTWQMFHRLIDPLRLRGWL